MPHFTRLTLRTAVVLPFLLIILSTFIVITLVQDRNYENMASEVSRNQLSVLGDTVELELSSFLDQPLQAAFALSHSIELHQLYQVHDVSAVQTMMLSKFSRLYSHISHLDNIGFGGEQGEYVGLRKEASDHFSLMLQDKEQHQGLVIYQDEQKNQNIRSIIKNYDPRTRPWYDPLAGKQNPHWSPIYANADERQEVTLSAIKPVYYQDELQGVVVSDVKLSTFNAFLNQQQKNTGAIIYVFDGDKRLVAQSTGGSIISWGTPLTPKSQRLLAVESTHSVIQSSAEYLQTSSLSGPGFSFGTNIDNERYFHWVEPYHSQHNLNWYIGVSISEHELLGSMLERQYQSWLVGLLISALGIVIGLMTFNRIVSPITATANTARQIAQGNWSCQLPKAGNVHETALLVHAFNDMTNNLKASLDEISAQLLFDSLTRLYSREGLVNTADKLNRLEGALIQIGLNKFRYVNDSIGHQLGDQLLMIVAERIRTTFEHDALIARIGGDEFAIYLTQPQTKETLSLAIGRTQQLFAAPFCMGQESIVIQPSLGVVEQGDDHDMTTWLRNGSIALSNTKQEQMSVSYYSPEMADVSRLKTRMITNIKQGIENQEFVPYYQPIVDIQTGKVIGAEALARWLSPNKGLISPLEFIPIAEESGFISAIGKQILRQACQDTMRGIQQGKWASDFHIHVNLSVNQLSQANLIDELQQALSESGLPAKNLTLEITESRLVDSDPVSIENMQAIRALGVQIAIDDFGTGYSSLAYIHKLPFNCLKIDRTFVNKLDQQNLDTSIVAAIINMTKGMQVDIVAEGIETVEQAEMLRKLKCAQGQGFLYSRPVPYEQWPTDLVNMQ